MDASLGFLYEPCPGGARVLRVFGDSPCPVLPGTVNGLPVTEIGPYCFSAREPRGGQRWPSDGPDHPICGEFVTEVSLPDSVQVLHSAAFYNCRQLKVLHLGPNVTSLGSDLFTNCRALEAFDLRCAPDASTGLKKLLGAVSSDIGATFTENGALRACLFYPEYFEYLDENTPAHIFNHSIEGEGYRYRQCFDGGILAFGEYDAAFDRACIGESARSLCRIAFARLLHPFALTEEARGNYLQYLGKHPADAAALALERRDAAALRLLGSEHLLDDPTRRDAAVQCGRLGWSEGAALLLESGPHTHRAKKSYDFDDL